MCGGAVCGAGLDFWTEWGTSSRDAGRGDFNIQNQSDLADWPCFSKYYVTFPLNSLPRGRVVVEARLILHHFGNAQPSDAKPSLIQVHVVEHDWDEQRLTWNNAPLASENVGAGWVPPLQATAPWPGIPREFELSRAVAAAYAANQPLRLVLYSADSAYHSGKYFVSSDTGDWNAAGRPTLIVTMRQ
ncbi:MAG: DNRLRE domain-containing protein [Oscillochloridaceae bacterium umkhey_bin13]